MAAAALDAARPPVAGDAARAAKATARAAAATRRARAHARLHPGAGPALSGGFRAAFADRLAPHRAVALYWPVRTEIDVRPLLEDLAAAGAPLALPIVRGPQAPLAFARWRPGDALHRRAFGLREPAATVAVTPAVVVVPLLAFDRSGARLGYGGGHYDRTLRRLRAAGPVLAVGAAYAEQEVTALAVEAHDEPLDAVITERGPAAVAAPPR